MQRLRFYDMRVSGFFESIGICSSDLPRVASILNEAQERLLHDPMAPDEGWYGGWARVAFNVTPPFDYIVCPREIARIILMDACKHPLKLRNQFFEFLEFGNGYQPEGCDSNNRCCQQRQAYERESVPTLSTFVAGNTVRAYPLDARDVGKRSVISGTDTNGKTIYSIAVLTNKPYNGETITFDIPFTDTSNAFNTVTSIMKDPTMGDVDYFQVSQVDGSETPLTTLQATETTAQYRRYFLNGLRNRCCGSSPQQVLALCKLDFIPAQSDQDYLLIQSDSALKEECMAVRYSRMDTPGSQQMAQAKHARALQLLFGQLDHFLGKFSTAITVPLFGSDRLKFQHQ